MHRKSFTIKPLDIVCTNIDNYLVYSIQLSCLLDLLTILTSLSFSLTCANKMSHQHVAETHKKLARLLEDGKKRAEQYEKALQRYQDTWSNHQKVYCSIPGVPQIMLLEDEVQALKRKGECRSLIYYLNTTGLTFFVHPMNL